MPLPRALFTLLPLLLAACSNGPASTVQPDAGVDAAVDAAPDAADAAVSKRGFLAREPWLSFRGSNEQLMVASHVADTFRVIALDVDPDTSNVLDSTIATLHGGGKNKVLAYLDVGACDSAHAYWATVPAGFVACKDGAQLGPYAGRPTAAWMNVGDADYQKLVVQYVAPRLAQRGVDGFYLDDLALVEHGANAANGPCDAKCSQGGLDLVRMLREAFPDMVIVMQGATGDVTRTGKTGGQDFPTLLDGVTHEAVYQPGYDATAEAQLTAWAQIGLTPGGNAFFVGDVEYVGDCTNTTAAQMAYAAARAKGFAPYATDSATGQKQICYWPF